MPDPRTVLITGGAGFIGSNLVRWILRHEPGVAVVNLDLLTYAGDIESLDDVARAHGATGDGRYFFVRGDVRDRPLVERLLAGDGTEPGTGRALPAPDTVLHLAAESHVDRSILGPLEFVSTNVDGTAVMLESVRRESLDRRRPIRFVNVSTDEVYGSLEADEPPFAESRPLSPNSPYAASKAGADCLVRAYRATYGLDCLTTRCSNNYGPYQFPEKLIPLTITKALDDQPVPVYGDGRNVRDWLHVEDHAAGIWAAATRGQAEDHVYNLGGGQERTNVEVVETVLDMLGKPRSLMRYVTDRPGHDRRYAIDASRSRDRLGWRPSHSFETGLRETVEWYRSNEQWWRRVQTKAYRASHALYPLP